MNVRILAFSCWLLSISAFATDKVDSLILAIAKSQRHKLISVEDKKIHPVEDSLYHTQSWKSYTFKSSEPLKKTGNEKYFFEYSVGVLKFGDTNFALKRLERVNAYYLPDDQVFKKTQFGLRSGSRVLFLTSYPMIFKPSLSNLYGKYCLAFSQSCPTLAAIPEETSEKETYQTLNLDSMGSLWVKLGFNIAKVPTDANPTDWEKQKFDLNAKRTMMVKSRFPSHLGREYFYRFWIDEERYLNEEKSKMRLDSLRVSPPNLKGEKEMIFHLRDGFRSGELVFVVRTDVGVYFEKLKQFNSVLEAINATQSPRVRNARFDSLREELQKK